MKISPNNINNISFISWRHFYFKRNWKYMYMGWCGGWGTAFLQVDDKIIQY